MDTTSSVRSIDQAIEEIMRIHRSLPTRPGIDEVEAAKTLILNVDKEDQARLESISRQTKSPDVPQELFTILQEMQKNLVYFQSKEQKREAMKLLDLESVHALFDEFIQRASKCLHSTSTLSSSSSSNGSASTVSCSGFSRATAPTSVNKSSITAPSNLYYSEKNPARPAEFFTRDDSYVKKAKSSFYSDGTGVSSMPHIVDSTLKTTVTTTGVLHFVNF